MDSSIDIWLKARYSFESTCTLYLVPQSYLGLYESSRFRKHVVWNESSNETSLKVCIRNLLEEITYRAGYSVVINNLEHHVVLEYVV